MALIPTSLDRTIIAQHGVLTTTQLEAAGMTGHEVRRLVTSGHLARVVTGTYRVSTHPDGELSRCVALSLAVPTAVVCGPTAGRLLGLRRLPRDRRLHALFPRDIAVRGLPGLVAYRPTDATQRAWSVRPDGIRMLRPEDLAVDLARFLRPHALASVIEQMIGDHGCSPASIAQAADRLHARRRPWLRMLRAVLASRLPGGAAESDGEVQLGAALRRAGVSGLERQHRITLPGYGRARFDLAVPEARWALEIDLHPSHFEPDRAAADARRDDAADAAGWMVRRVVADDMRSLTQLARRLAAEVGARRLELGKVPAL